LQGQKGKEKEMANPYTYDANRSKVKYTDHTPYELDNPKKRRMLTPVNRYLLVAIIAIPLLLIIFYLMGGFPH
jgi:ABC-type uncharacterized transport system involved in gliding motility auxiliary subunit